MNIINNRFRINLGNFAQILEWGDIQNPITVTFTKDCCQEESIRLDYTKRFKYGTGSNEVTLDSMKVQYIDVSDLYGTVQAKDFSSIIIENLETGERQSVDLTSIGSATNVTQFMSAISNNIANINSQIENIFGTGNQLLALDNKIYTVLPIPNVAAYIQFYDSAGISIRYNFIPLTSGVEGVYFTPEYLYLDSPLEKFEDGVWKVDIDYKYENYESIFNITDSIFIDNTLNCFISDIIGNPSVSKEDKSDIVIAYSSLKILNTCPTKDYRLMCNILKGLYKVVSKPSNNLKNRSCNEC